MLFAATAAAMLATAAPNTHAVKVTPRTDQKAKVEGAEDKAPDFDPAQLIAMFDKLFPAQPDPAPARLALSQVAVKGLFPDGTYSRMMDDMMGSIVDRVLDFSEADFGKKGKDGKPPSSETLRQAAMKEDPYFEERMKITERVLGEEMAKLAVTIEPRLREGLARSMARRFDEKQLGDINAFLATDSGRAFGSQSMAMWFDADVMRSIVGSFPEIIVAMPGAIKRLEDATAHLPKPKSKDKGKQGK
jgi:hypothetical protein